MSAKLLLISIEKFDPKFCFLNPFDAYHKYYALRLQECRAGKASSIAPRLTGSTEKSTAKVTQQEPVKERPRDFKFSAQVPPISAQDLDILRLTAQFVAKNGRSFITTLSQRESRNYQFDFLRSNHSLYPYFNVLVQQYSQILAPPPSLNSLLSQGRNEIYERCQRRAEFTKDQALAKIKQKEDEEKDRIAYASIDWHAFTVVETIEFTASDEAVELAPPVDLLTLKSASLEQKALMKTLAAPSLALASSVKPLAIEAPPPSTVDDHVNPARRTYLPKSVAMQKCPRCGEMFRSDEIDEHMRIELLDPKWKLQKEKEQQKRSSTNLSTETAAQNLKRMTPGTAITSEAKRRKEDIGPY